MERYNFLAAWEYLTLCESLCSKHNHFPKTLVVLRNTLQRKLPKPKKRFI